MSGSGGLALDVPAALGLASLASGRVGTVGAVNLEASPAVYAFGGCSFLLAAIAGGFAGEWLVVALAVVAAVWMFAMAVVIRRRS